MSTTITEEEWEEIKKNDPTISWEEIEKGKPHIEIEGYLSPKNPRKKAQEQVHSQSLWKHVLLMGLLEAGLWIAFIASLVGSFFLLGAGMINESTTQMVLSIPTIIVCVITGVCAKLIHDRNREGEL